MKIRIKNLEFRIKVFKKTVQALCFILTALFLPFPVYAKVEIKDFFGFGDITSLGQGVNKLIAPMFSVAAALVVIYFLFGAFKWLRSQGNKEELEGARQMITHAIIGFIILIFAFFVLQYIPQFFELPGLDIIK